MSIEAKVIRGYIRKGSLVLGIGFCSFFLFRILPSFFVYRFLPSLFGVLVSSSPVILCTAILLGILLSFGQQNIPEVKEEENRTIVTSSRARCIADDLVVEKAARVDEKAIKWASFGRGTEEILIGERAVIEDNEKEINGEKKVIKVEKREFHDNIGGHSIDDQQKEIKGQQINDHNGSSDSGSDADSSSPDASITDVMPMIDELDPLIDSKAPVPTFAPQDESDAHESDDGSADLAGDVETADEEAQEKAVVTWTEDDEKNLKDLGTLELERNQRLENLIAKRRARKRWMVEAEKNLIDFDVNDGMQISILTRRNPFDQPYDLDEIMGLPPIPGSAPSVLLPRLNPFDIPCDRADERSNLVGENSSQQESTMHQQRDTFFRRYESFTMGTSFLGEMKQEKHDHKLRPFFVEEGVGYDTTLPRQFSERGDTKISSIPETDTVSISSITDKESDEKELLEQELYQGGVTNSLTNCASERIRRDNDSSEDVDSVVTDSNPCDSIEETPQDPRAFMTMNVETGQVEEPVYDSSPSSINKSLSNMTSISETLFDAPPVTVDRSIFHGNVESMSNNENERIEMTSNSEMLWVAPPTLSAVDENESRSEGVKEVSECDFIQVGLIPEAIVKQFSKDVSSSSPVAKSVEDGVMDEKVNHQYKEAKVIPSFDQEIHDVDPQTDMTAKAGAEGNHKQSQDLSSLQNKSAEETNNSDNS